MNDENDQQPKGKLIYCNRKTMSWPDFFQDSLDRQKNSKFPKEATA